MNKVCKQCGLEKQLDEFPKLQSGYGDGHINICKACKSLYRKKYYSDNREKLIQDSIQWGKENAERRYSTHKLWKKNNPEKVKQKSREYYLKHREERLAWFKKYAQEHPDKRRESNRKSYQKNPFPYQAKWHRRRARIVSTDDGTVTAESLEQMLKDQNYQCNLCGTDIMFERNIDHIAPLNPRDKSVPRGKHTITNIQLLCCSCNLKKSDRI